MLKSKSEFEEGYLVNNPQEQYYQINMPMMNQLYGEQALQVFICAELQQNVYYRHLDNESVAQRLAENWDCSVTQVMVEKVLRRMKAYKIGYNHTFQTSEPKRRQQEASELARSRTTASAATHSSTQQQPLGGLFHSLASKSKHKLQTHRLQQTKYVKPNSQVVHPLLRKVIKTEELPLPSGRKERKEKKQKEKSEFQQEQVSYDDIFSEAAIDKQKEINKVKSKDSADAKMEDEGELRLDQLIELHSKSLVLKSKDVESTEVSAEKILDEAIVEAKTPTAQASKKKKSISKKKKALVPESDTKDKRTKSSKATFTMEHVDQYVTDIMDIKFDTLDEFSTVLKTINMLHF